MSVSTYDEPPGVRARPPPHAGKVAEVARAVAAQRVDTVIFDDELSPGQLRNLEKVRGVLAGERKRESLLPEGLPAPEPLAALRVGSGRASRAGIHPHNVR